MIAHYLPTVYTDTKSLLPPFGDSCTAAAAAAAAAMPTAAPAAIVQQAGLGSSSDWVKVEAGEDIYEDLDDGMGDTPNAVKLKVPATLSVPQHSLAAFALFLRLPSYSEVLLRDRLKAQCLLRLVLGVTGDGEGSKFIVEFSLVVPSLHLRVLV